MPARRRNLPPTSTSPSTTPATTPATKKATRATTATTTTSAQARTGAAVAMATTTTTLRRSPRLIVTGHHHESRALQKQTEPKTKSLKRQCCQPGRTRAGRGVLPDPVVMASSSSTSEEEEEDTRVTCTTRRKRKENSTTLLVESPAKRLRTRAVVVTATAPPKPRSKPKASSQAPSLSSTSRPPAGGRLTRSSTIASRATITARKIAPNKNNTLCTSRRSSPEPAPSVPAPAPPPPSPPPQHGPPLMPCKSNASSPTSSPSASAFALLAASPQRAPLELIDIGPPLISHNESSRHSGFSGIPGLVSSSTEYTKDGDHWIKEGNPIKTVTGTGIWTSPPSPLTPLSTAPPSPTSPTTSTTDVFDVKLDMLSSSLSSPPSSPVLPSVMPSLAAASSPSSAAHDSMDVDVPNTASDANLTALEAVSVTQNILIQIGPSPNQSEDGVNVPLPMTQPPSTIQDITTTATTYGFSQEQSPHLQLSPQAQPQASSQSQSQSQLVQTQGQTQGQPQQSAFTHSYAWYELPDSSAQQQQIIHWEEPPRLESTKNVWKFACKYRVWDVLCRYTPNIIRSVVAQEASDYHTVHGYPGAYFARARHQRMRRRAGVDTSAAFASGGGTSASSSGHASGGRKRRRKAEVDEKGGKEKKKGPKSKSRNGTPTPDVMEGVEILVSSTKECKGLQLPTLPQSSPQPSPTSPPPETERERFMDEEYYDWEIRSDGDEDDEEVFYYYDEDDEDEDDDDDDDECYDEETDSEDEDYMDDEMFDGSQAIETVEKHAERVSTRISEDGKKKHRTGDASLGIGMDMDVSKDPSFNAELTTSLSCSSTPPPTMVPGNGDGCAKVTSSEGASLQQHQEDVGTAKGVESSPLLAPMPASTSGATAVSSFLPSTPPHSLNTNVKQSSPTRGDTLISMFYCPPPHPQHVNHLNSHAHSLQVNLASAPQHQLQTQEPSPQPVQLSQPLQSQQQERPLQPMESPQPVQSLHPPQPMKPLQPIPSTHPSSPPASSPFVSDPCHLSLPIRPSTPVPTSPVFCMNEYGGGSDRYQSNAVPATTSSSSPLAPTSPVNPISPTTPMNPTAPISPLSTPIPAPPVLPLPPPRLASIRVRPLRYGDLGLASVIGKGTPVDRDRAMQWARAGQCGFTWSTTASGTSTEGNEASRMREMSDVVMTDVREECRETKDMGEVTANPMALGSVNNGECEMKVEQEQSQGQHRSLELQQEPLQQQHGHQEQAQRQPQGSQEQDKMQIVTAFSETDQSIWDAFFATLQAAEHDVTGEVKPESATEATSSPAQSMLNPGDTNTTCIAPGSVAASSPQMIENGNNGAPLVAPGNSAPPTPTALNVNATTTTMFTSMGFGLGGALGMGFVSGSVNVNHISLGFGPSGGVPPGSQQGSSTSGDQCSTLQPTSSPLTSHMSGGPLSNMMNPLYPAHHPSPAHMGTVIGDISSMTMNGVQTYLSGSPLSIPLSMSMPMGMSGMGTMDTMGMTIPMPVVPSHESSSSSPPTPMTTAVAGGSPSCAGNSTPGTSALSFALG
ncbi:hypothetical protein M378DRAFT_10624 [Amanita muscaria Koide BX008]|uniref:Uncharacterized protein n=1 Tax=Amanita muscaria (strain Koide BX008) TaxID=946122 RepID=A0A0C2WVG9_AMAMK|nr:hypothetical protein M378DRAFT_10624 [Amanita muscaria Koide BX008]